MSGPRVQVSLEADTTKFAAGVQSAMGSLRGLLSAGALASAAKAAVDLGSNITDLANKSKVSTKWLQEVGYAAKMAGSSMEDVSQAVLELGRSQVQALAGSAGEKNAFAALGISMQDLRNLNPEQLFDAVAKSVKDAGGSAESMNAAIQVMGRSGMKLVGGMADGFDEARQRAEELGLVLDEQTIASLDQLGDNLDTIKIKFTAWTAEILKNATSLNNWTHLAQLAGIAMHLLNPANTVAAFASGGFRGVADLWRAARDAASEVVDRYQAADQAEAAAASEAARQRTGAAPDDVTERRRGRGGTRPGDYQVDSLARIGLYVGGGGGMSNRLLSIQNSALEQLRVMRRELVSMNRRRARGQFDF